MKNIKWLTLLAVLLIVLCSFASCSGKKDKDSNNGGAVDAIYYEVTFETNEGSTLEPKRVHANSKIREPERPIKEGYEFSGWFLDSEFTTMAMFPLEISNNITLYAKWTKYHLVKFETNDGSIIKPVQVLEGESLDGVEEPVKDGYTFDGWYLDEGTTVLAIFPLTIRKETQLYAKWLKALSISEFDNAKLKNWGKNDDSVSYNISFDELDLDALAEKGFKIKIKVTYDVYYEKDYDVPFDIGYAGAPKYDVRIQNSEGNGYSDEDKTTTTSAKTRTFEATFKIATLKNDKISLVFETANIQNLIYFKNISVTCECVK